MQITVYPNPTTGKVRLQGLEEEPVAIELYDMTGRHVATFYRTDSLDIGHLANGSYIVSVISPRNRYLVKLIKW